MIGQYDWCMTEQPGIGKWEAIRSNPGAASSLIRYWYSWLRVYVLGAHISELLWWCNNLHWSCLILASVILQWLKQNPVGSFWLRLPWSTRLRYRAGIAAEIQPSEFRIHLGWKMVGLKLEELYYVNNLK